MNGDNLSKLLLGIIAVLLLMNFAQGLFSIQSAGADKSNGETGRYQISAWAAPTSVGYHHSGYYVIDTVTGKMVESKSEIHSSKN